MAVREYLNHLDAGEKRWQDTLVALDQVERGELVDGDEMLRWIGSWGTRAEAGNKPAAPRSARRKK